MLIRFSRCLKCTKVPARLSLRTAQPSPRRVDGAAGACVVPARLLSWLKASVNRGPLGVAGSGLKLRVVNHRIQLVFEPYHASDAFPCARFGLGLCCRSRSIVAAAPSGWFCVSGAGLCDLGLARGRGNAAIYPENQEWPFATFSCEDR